MKQWTRIRAQARLLRSLKRLGQLEYIRRECRVVIQWRAMAVASVDEAHGNHALLRNDDQVLPR